MAFFVSCSSDQCPKRGKCGRRSHYVDDTAICDFYEKFCKTDTYDTMFLTQMDVRENDMAKKKINDVK